MSPNPQDCRRLYPKLCDQASRRHLLGALFQGFGEDSRAVLVLL